ncbi:MAG: helix-turn-helix domain-containing protein [Candidatus Heimdallarchaeota archaeon]
MCEEECGCSDLEELKRFQKYFRALHCPTRWIILRLLGDTTKSSGELFEGLTKVGEGLSKSGFYYHLSELEAADIIELVEYRESGGGAPTKVWRLKTKEIKINLLEVAGKALSFATKEDETAD